MRSQEQLLDLGEVEAVLLFDLLQDLPAGRDGSQPFHPLKGIFLEYICQYDFTDLDNQGL